MRSEREGLKDFRIVQLGLFVSLGMGQSQNGGDPKGEQAENWGWVQERVKRETRPSAVHLSPKTPEGR